MGETVRNVSKALNIIANSKAYFNQRQFDANDAWIERPFFLKRQTQFSAQNTLKQSDEHFCLFLWHSNF